ncbi:hypothetical protein GQX74_010414 [Glossina fuscipes]|nr:hypothetical protein GQX74_010414 [Glossina fuscipes]
MMTGCKGTSSVSVFTLRNKPGTGPANISTGLPKPPVPDIELSPCLGEPFGSGHGILVSCGDQDNFFLGPLRRCNIKTPGGPLGPQPGPGFLTPLGSSSTTITTSFDEFSLGLVDGDGPSLLQLEAAVPVLADEGVRGRLRFVTFLGPVAADKASENRLVSTSVCTVKK